MCIIKKPRFYGAIENRYHERFNELNLISWNDAAPKYDIRDWAPEHEKMGKGVTLTKEEAAALFELLKVVLSK